MEKRTLFRGEVGFFFIICFLVYKFFKKVVAFVIK